MLWISLHLFPHQVLNTSVWMTRTTAAQGLTRNFTHSRTRSLTQLLSNKLGISEKANLCSCEASTKLLAILSNRLKIITLRHKSNIQAALIQMLGCHDFSTHAAGNLPNSKVMSHHRHELTYCFVFIVQQYAGPAQ